MRNYSESPEAVEQPDPPKNVSLKRVTRTPELKNIYPLLLQTIQDPHSKDNDPFRDRYFVNDVIDLGATGVVYEAFDKKMDRPVALKVLDRSLARNSPAIARLKHEAKMVGGLFNPGILRIYDFFVDSEFGPILVLEREESKTLYDQVYKGEEIPPTQIKKIFTELIQTLKFLIVKKIRYRDIKPSNIFLNPFFTKVLDFDTATSYQLPESGTGFTYDYMAPEMYSDYRGKPDEVSLFEMKGQIFSLGVIIYEIMTKTRPFKVEDPDDQDQWLAAVSGYTFHLERHPEIQEYILKHRLGITEVETFFQKCLAGESEQRYQNFEEFLEGLTAAVTPAPEAVVDELPAYEQVQENMRKSLLGNTD
jgi:eukaryotic-like serine/threonine-protein kinase